MQNAIDVIADNYTESIPLIFGEWDLLKRILKILAIYNFDIIIGLKQSVDDRTTPILSSGYKEYYDDMSGITEYSRKQLMDIGDKGIAVCNEFERKREDAILYVYQEVDLYIKLFHFRECLYYRALTTVNRRHFFPIFLSWILLKIQYNLIWISSSMI